MRPPPIRSAVLVLRPGSGGLAAPPTDWLQVLEQVRTRQVIVLGSPDRRAMRPWPADGSRRCRVLYAQACGCGECAGGLATLADLFAHEGVLVASAGWRANAPALGMLYEAFLREEADAVLAVRPEAGQAGSDDVAATEGPVMEVGETDWPASELAVLRGAVLEELAREFRSAGDPADVLLGAGQKYLAAQAGSGRWKVRAVVVRPPAWIGPREAAPSDTPAAEEPLSAGPLLAQYRFERSPRQFKTVEEWLSLLRSPSPGLRATLARTYGSDAALQARRVKVITQVLDLFARRHGAERTVVITRAPGRINLMGRHVDHRGGYVNMMAIQREIVCVASPRDDACVSLVNLAPEFPETQFDVARELPYAQGTDWHTYINSAHVKELHLASTGHWSNYVRAGILRLWHDHLQLPFVGLDVAVGGDIPQGAGLSSSSALLVSTTLAAIRINELPVGPAEFVDLAGEGEWFVGTRGGASDHAAVTMGKAGRVTRIAFFPFEVMGDIPFPEDHRLVFCDSSHQAKKTEGARDIFNHRVACYGLGFALLRTLFPERLRRAEHLRDLVAPVVGLKPSDLYRMLSALPEQTTRPELLKALPAEQREWAEAVFGTHTSPTTYDLRGVLLYGLAECRRSEMCGPLLHEGRVQAVGELMNLSHDGDRVVRHVGSGEEPYLYRCDAGRLEELLTDLASENPEWVARAQVHRQAGSYRCSTPEIDRMVDTALQVPGVVGAQLSGAGLGGCMMALVRTDHVPDLERALIAQYYTPLGLEPSVEATQPIEGASALEA